MTHQRSCILLYGWAASGLVMSECISSFAIFPFSCILSGMNCTRHKMDEDKEIGKVKNAGSVS